MAGSCVSLRNETSPLTAIEFCVADREIIEAMRAMSPRHRAGFPIPAICVTCLAVGLFANGLVLAVIATDRSFRTLTNAVLASFATADVIFLLLTVPVIVARQSYDSWNASIWVCTFSNYIEYFANANFVWHLIVIGIQNYIVVLHPLKAKRIMTRRTGCRMIAAVWVCSAALALVAAFSSVLNRTLYATTTSRSDVLWEVNNCIVSLPLRKHGIPLYFLQQALLLFALPFLGLVYMYARVIHSLWFTTKQLHSTTRCHAGLSPQHATDRQTDRQAERQTERQKMLQAGARTQRRNPNIERRKQTIVMLLVVMAVFFLTWLPKCAFLLLLEVGREHKGDRLILISMTLVQNLPFVQCCANPFIYAFVSKNWRAGLVKLVKRPDCRRTRCCS